MASTERLKIVFWRATFWAAIPDRNVYVYLVNTALTGAIHNAFLTLDGFSRQ